MSQKNTIGKSPKPVELVSPAAADTTTTQPNKNLAITNNSSVNVAMLDAVADNEYQVVFEQNLTLLPTNSSGQYIASQKSGSVVLNDSHMYKGVLTYSKLYDIIYVKPGTLFPIKSQGAMLSSITYDYAPVTVTDDEVKVMKQTEAFLQNIAASPTSALAQGYANILAATTDSGKDDVDIDDKIASFFAGTKEYKQVTLDSVITLSSYYNTFPIVWAAYQATKTYYFYTSDGTAVKYKGSLTIEVPTTIGLDKSLPGFKFTYTDENNKTTPLYYADGLFVEDKDVDTPHLSIAGTFVTKSLLTGVDSDVDIIPILSGTIYKQQVVGYDTRLDLSGGGTNDDDRWGGFFVLLHPKNGAGVAAMFLEFVGLVMGIDFFFGKPLKALKDKILDTLEDGGVLSPGIVDKLRTEVKDRSGLNDPKYKAKMEKLGLQDQATKSIPDQMKDADAKYQDCLTENWRTATDIKLDKMSNMLEKMIDSGHVTQGMEDAGDALYDAYDQVDQPSTADLSQQITDLNTSIENLRLNINDQFSAIMNKLKGTALTEINDAKAAAEDAKATVDKVTDDLNKAKDGTPDSGEPRESGADVDTIE